MGMKFERGFSLARRTASGSRAAAGPLRFEKGLRTPQQPAPDGQTVCERIRILSRKGGP